MSEILQERKAGFVDAPKSKIPVVEAQEVPSSKAVGEIDQAMQKQELLCGANTASYNVTGKNLAFIRKSLKALLNIPPEAVAFVDGKEMVDEQYVVVAKDQAIEFILGSGTKGSPCYIRTYVD